MTDAELYTYLWELSSNTNVSKDKNVVGWTAKTFYHILSDKVYEKYGKRLITPTHICESLNPFTIHFTWDDGSGNVLGCLVKENPEIYVCFSHSYFYKNEIKTDSWKEFVYLPNLEVSDKLMEVFYLYYLEKNNEQKILH